MNLTDISSAMFALGLLMVCIVIAVDLLRTTKVIRDFFEQKNDEPKNNTSKTHAQIKKISFRTPIQSQYDKYKNTDGLYEPVQNKTPKRRNINKEI